MKTLKSLRLLRTVLVVAAAAFAGLLPPLARAAHSPDFPGNNWQNGLASVSANQTLYKAGDTVTVSVTCNSDYWCQNLILGVPGAISATLDGADVPEAGGAGYYDHLFDANPHPSPFGCFFINYPGGAGSHTATFKLGSSASGKFTKRVVNGVTQISGPFVILDRPQYQMWSTLFPIEIDGGKSGDLSVSKTAQTVKPDGAKPEENVSYTLTATAPSTAKQIVLQDHLPSGVTLVGSLGSNGTVKGSLLKWTIPGGGTVTRTYQVKVAKYRELPRGLKSLVTNVRGIATLENRRTTSAAARNTVNLILPWTIRGIAKDILFDFQKSPTVNLKRVTPFVDVELVDASGNVVDTDNGKASGAFELHARNPGKHRIRGKAKGDRYDSTPADALVPGGAYVYGGADVEVLAADPPSKEYKKDFYVPVSLNNHFAKQLRTIREFKAVDTNFAGFGYTDQSIQDFLGGVLGINIQIAPPYDAQKAIAMLTQAQKFDGFTDNVGQPIFFEKLYDGTGNKDGWSAVVRLSAFLDMLTLRQKEFAKMTEKAGTAFAKAIALSIVTKQGQQRAAKVKTLIAEKRFSELPPLADANVEAAKIASLGFGVGMALPAFLDKLGVSGEQKGKIIEIVAKLARYGPDILLRKFLPGKLTDDLVFELLFQPIRFVTIVELQNLYVGETQSDFNELADDLRLGVYSEDTTKIIDALDREDGRLRDRSEYSLGLMNSILGVTSFARALDGVTFKLTKPLEALQGTKYGSIVATPLLGVANLLNNGGGLVPVKGIENMKIVDTAKMTNARTPLKTTVLVAGIGSVLEITLWEFVLRDRDILSFSNIAFQGKFSDGSSAVGTDQAAAFALSQPASKTSSSEVIADLAPLSISRAASIDPLSVEGKYLAALTAINKAIDSRIPGDLAIPVQQLATAHTAFFSPLIALHDRLVFVGQTIAEADRADARRFILAVEELLTVTAQTYGNVFMLPKVPNASMTALARSNIRTLEANIKTLSRVLALSARLGTNSGLPGNLRLREGNAPTDVAVLSGNPFDLEIEVKNVGDSPTASTTLELLPGTDLTLVSAGSTSVPALQSGESVTMIFSAKARAVDAAGQALSYVARVSGAAGASTQLSGFILAAP